VSTSTVPVLGVVDRGFHFCLVLGSRFCVSLDLHSFRFTKGDGDGVAVVLTWWWLKVAERPVF
jgi:hypothetical protein